MGESLFMYWRNTMRHKNLFKSIIYLGLLSFTMLAAGPKTDAYAVWLEGFDLEPRHTLSGQKGYADYLSVLAGNNPELKDLFHRWQSARSQVVVAGGWADPQLTGAIAARPVVTGQGPQNARIGISQRIPRRGELSSGTGTQMAIAEMSLARLKSRFNDLNLDLRRSYANLYLTQRKLEIQEQVLSLLENWQEVLLTRYSNASAGHPDLVKTQLELIGMEDEILRTKLKLSNMKDQLRILLQLDTNAPVQAPQVLDLAQNSTARVPGDDWVRGNPGYQLMDANRQAAVLGAELTRIKTRPQLMLGLDWSLIGPADMVNPALNAGQDAIAATVGLTLPLWSSRNKASISASQSMVSAQEESLNAVEHQLRLGMEQVHREYGDAQRRLQLLEQTMIPKSKQIYAVMETAYTAGNADLLSLLDAVENMLKYELQLEEARVDLWMAHARLNHLKGLLL